MSKTLTNLKSLTKFLATGDSTSTEFNDTDILIAINSRYQDSFLMATANDGDFEFNGDGSQSINITAGTRAYSLATDLYKVSRVEIKYPGTASDYQQAIPINGGQIQYYGKDNYVPSVPEIDLIGDKVEIFVSAKTADITAVTGGIKVYYQKELTELSGASDEIIFPDVFARYLALGASIDYCGVNELTSRLNWLKSEYIDQENKLTVYVADRNKAKRASISFRRENYGAEEGFASSDKQVF
jgi:hypothetical protein